MDTRRFILRLVAGGYVFYSGIQLIQGYLNGMIEMNAMFSLGIGALFLIFGAWSVLSGVIPVVKNGGFITTSTDDTTEESDEEADQTEVAEEVSDGEDVEQMEEVSDGEETAQTETDEE